VSTIWETLDMFGLFLKMFLHFRSWLICSWLLCNGSPLGSVLFWSPTRLISPYCFSIYTRLQDL